MCVSGLTASARTDSAILKRVKETVPDLQSCWRIPGCVWKRVEEQLIADGCVTAATFKRQRLRQLVDERAWRSLWKKGTPYPTIKWG
ncbi:hypothetical protein KCP73_25985 [Salmonella enterica subsp. enterica]|nr:hypothetical protein KCP73_25985 [Salmonella enterica subsp. enterica]